MPAQWAFNLQRQERLLAELRRHGAVRVADLAPLLQASEVTIRRDIQALAQRRLLTRTHGGAILPSTIDPGPRRPRRPTTGLTLGMVVPSLDFYWPPIVAGARTASTVVGVDLKLRGSSYDPDEDRRQIDRLLADGNVQGLLLAPDVEAEGAAATLDWISDLPVPTVLVERQPTAWTQGPRPLEYVSSDHALGVEAALRHLRHHGHRRIGLVVTPASPTTGRLVRGFSQACAALEIPDDLVFRVSVRLDEPEREARVADVLRRCGQAGATALLVHSDPDATSVAQFCAEHGVAVPRDLALVSYDDDVANLAEPALTAIRPAKRHVGRLAVELLASRLLEGGRRPAQRVLVAPELVIRRSSVAAPRR